MVLIIPAVPVSCEKDKPETEETILKYLFFCPAGNSAACRSGCIGQFDKDGDGAVEDIYSSSYSSCTTACDRYCEAALYTLITRD